MSHFNTAFNSNPNFVDNTKSINKAVMRRENYVFQQGQQISPHNSPTYQQQNQLQLSQPPPQQQPQVNREILMVIETPELYPKRVSAHQIQVAQMPQINPNISTNNDTLRKVDQRLEQLNRSLNSSAVYNSQFKNKPKSGIFVSQKPNQSQLQQSQLSNTQTYPQPFSQDLTQTQFQAAQEQPRELTIRVPAQQPPAKKKRSSCCVDQVSADVINKLYQMQQLTKKE